jgi:hypothetical protein
MTRDLEWHENKLRRRMEVAAPEMLKALQEAVTDADEICTSANVITPATLALIRAAIAKATGQS